MSQPLHLYTIPPDAAFVDALAVGLMQQAEHDPIKLATMRVLLPTRRATQALRDAFLRLSGGTPMLLPVMQPIGDVDEDELLLTGWFSTSDEPHPLLSLPPSMPGSRRILLLAALINRFHKQVYGDEARLDQAVHLARELAAFFDESVREGADMSALADLVTGDLAEHWRLTVDFLHIVTQQWPQILEDEKRMDASQRRNLLLGLLAEHWQTTPPPYPVIAAGTTGSAPATARLLGVIAGMEQGSVVLPGLDTTMPDAHWQVLDTTHSQYGMQQLLAGMKAKREDVRLWGEQTAKDESPRMALLQAAMQPASTTDDWRQLRLPWEEALRGLKRVDCASGEQEATTIALIMREALQTPDKTAALVTPSRDLARRVAAKMARFGVAVDDSSGVPLSQTPPGVFLRLLAEAVAGRLVPSTLLALLKHPLARFGHSAVECRRLTRWLELAILRGVRLQSGFDAMRTSLQRMAEKQPERAALLMGMVEQLDAVLSPLCEAMAEENASLVGLLATHMQVAEAAATDAQGVSGLWQGESGQMLAAYLDEIQTNGDIATAFNPRHYPHVLGALLAGKAWRPSHGLHPRLKILSPMEARLQRFDRVILAGLNEGSWPGDVGHDPWMSRPMRQEFGLSLPERAVGLSAHDFIGQAAAGEVILSRAQKEAGTPTVPSRWLSRLEAVLGVQGGEAAVAAWRESGAKWRHWAETLDRQGANITPCPAPAPKPATHARPDALPVTAIETLLRNPYGVYAKYVLGLRKLDALDEEPGNREFGTLVHGVIERFIKREAAGDARPLTTLFTECADAVFAEWLERPAIAAMWKPKLRRISQQFLNEHSKRKTMLSRVAAECDGALEWVLPSTGRRFRLHGRIDRVEYTMENSVRLVDYKTGSIPSQSDIRRGLAPQLLLEALMLAEGRIGNEELSHNALEDLEYWLLKGGSEEGAFTSLAQVMTGKGGCASLSDWVAEQGAQAKDYLAAFDSADTPYVFTPTPQDAPTYDDYEHLARPQEWSS